MSWKERCKVLSNLWFISCLGEMLLTSLFDMVVLELDPVI